MSAGVFSATLAGSSSCVGLKVSRNHLFLVQDNTVAWTRKTVSNGFKTCCMKSWNPIDNWKCETLSDLPPFTDESIAKEIDYIGKETWNPIDNRKFETLSYLPPLTDESTAKEIDYMLKKGWIPCLEFDAVGTIRRENSQIPGYYDGRYWTLWKLPMFGCDDASQVLNEIEECRKTYPNSYIRIIGFDTKVQGQCIGFIAQKPETTSSSS